MVDHIKPSGDQYEGICVTKPKTSDVDLLFCTAYFESRVLFL